MKSLKNFTKNSFNDEVSKYLLYIRDIRGYSQRTITTYQLTLSESLDKIEFDIKDDLTILNITAYRTKIAKQNRRTISKKLSTIRSFVTYLQDKGFSVKLKGDDSIKVQKTLPKPIEQHHIEEALNKANEEEYIIVLLIYGLGLRISELSSLKIDDFSNGWVTIFGKGSKSRQVPVLREIEKVLDSYLTNYNPKLYVFEKSGERLSENILRYKIKKLFSKIGIKASPHQLRHSYATDILNGGGRITDVSKLLGHSSLSTTEIYTKLNSGVKMQNYLHAHPLCRGDDGN
jgi:integrase/recombinase XerC